MVVAVLGHLLGSDFGDHRLHASTQVSSHLSSLNGEHSHAKVDVEFQVFDVMLVEAVIDEVL